MDDGGDLIRRAMGEVWKGNFGLVAEDYVDHDLPPGYPEGKAGLQALYEAVTTGFPDFSVDVEQTVAEGDWVAARVTNRGTHEGSFMGMEPTGRRATWQTIAFFRIDDGKIVERHGLVDAPRLVAQLTA